MANAFLGYADVLEGLADSAITASKGEANFPVTNLFRSHPGDRYEFATPATPPNIDIDLGTTNLGWKFISLNHTNATSTARWTVQHDDNAGFMSPTTVVSNVLFTTTDADEAPTTGRHGFALLSTPVDEQYVRIQPEDSGLSGNFIIGSVTVSTYDPFETLNIAYGSDYGALVDRSRFGLTSRGRLMVTRGRVGRRYRFQALLRDKTKVHELLNMYELGGGNREFVFVRDTAVTSTRWEQGMVVGHLRGQFQVREQTSGDHYVVTNELIER